MKKSIFIAILWLFTTTVFAAYLRNVPITLTQLDGTKIECFATGDEYYNWVHDKDGYTIIRDVAGYLVYAMLKNDELQSSGLVVGKDSPKGLTPWTIISAEKRTQLRTAREARAQSGGRETNDIQTGQNNGNINNIVIFIRFSDENEFTRPLSYYDDMHNKDVNNYSSMYRYYKDASYNQTHINSTFYPTTSSNVVLSYKDIYPRSYYQPYHATTNPGGYNSDTESTTREFDLLERAINAVKGNIPTSLNLDFNGDGRVDNICFIIRGNAGNWSDLLWPHRWVIYDRTVMINGLRAYDFNLQLDEMLSVGVLVHEMFHTLGSPDLYRYSDNTIDPVGIWDVMCYDLDLPQSSTAHVKHKYGGWINEIPTITQSGTYTLNNIWESTNNAYKIASPNSTSEYFVIEYRDKNQFWDASLPGSGLIITRINPSFNGNSNGPPDEVYVYRPGASNTTTRGNLNTAYFSSNAGRTEFSNTTNPPCFLSNNSLGGIHIRNISESGGTTMSFEFVMPTDNAKLDNIVSNIPFTPSFNQSVYNYTMTVPCETDEVTITPVPSDGSNVTMIINGTSVTMPIKINVGDAPKTLLIRSVNGSDVADYSIQIISPFDYNKVVALIWDNVLSVINVPNHNGGYNFVSQQWIENGELLNERGGNLYLSNRSNYQTAVYNVKLTIEDGLANTTCNQNSLALSSESMVVFPNPVKVGGIINVNTFLLDKELDGAKIRIINMQGVLVKEVSAGYKTTISAPNTQGNYVLQITTKKGTTKTFNIVVQ